MGKPENPEPQYAATAYGQRVKSWLLYTQVAKIPLPPSVQPGFH